MSLIENIRDNNWKPQHKPSQEDWIFKLRITSLFYFKIYNIFIEFSTNFFFSFYIDRAAISILKERSLH